MGDSLVYSTEHGSHCPDCGNPESSCQCKEAKREIDSSKPISLSRQTKGRNGKPVTILNNIPLSSMEIKFLAKELKQHCGCGGTVKDDTIEIQGDKREICSTYLQSKGFKVKRVGG